MNKKELTKSISWILLVLLALLIPFVVKNLYNLHILILMFINIMLAASLYLINTTRQVSAAHAAFMGLGGYTSAILTMQFGFPFWAAFPLAGVVPAVIAVLIGYPSLRIKGVYFIIITFSFGEIIRLVWVKWRSIFGGPSGITGIESPDPIHLPGLPELTFTSTTEMYYLIFIVACLSLFILFRIIRSRAGMTFTAIGEADELCQSVGVNVMMYKIVAFAIGCFFAGLSGSLYAHYIHTISPYDFTFSQSITIIIYVVVGGPSPAGAVVGAIVLTILSEILANMGNFDNLGLGIILVLVVLFIKGGLIELPSHLVQWTHKLRRF
jgi:branched-chain amino acid transport system permease protein